MPALGPHPACLVSAPVVGVGKSRRTLHLTNYWVERAIGVLRRTEVPQPRVRLGSNALQQRRRQRDLPMPGSPESNTTCPSPVFAFDQRLISSSSSSSRPTSSVTPLACRASKRLSTERLAVQPKTSPYLRCPSGLSRQGPQARTSCQATFACSRQSRRCSALQYPASARRGSVSHRRCPLLSLA